MRAAKQKILNALYQKGRVKAMPDKVIEAVDALNKVEAALNEIFSECSFSGGAYGKKEVHLFEERDLEQVPGETQCEPWDCEGYPEYRSRIFKVCNGVEFFYLAKDRPKEAS
ncbi:MAG: hypothetical protein A4E56_00178 [Pelotomaculum sp. PtaU1.Bin065]|nr:MAG: hypothetical protein A4E56_00178 [Pelotomaculum sp. PtaU1.Bin065]